MVFDERTGPGIERDTVGVLKISGNACGVERFGVDLIVFDSIAIDERDLESPFVSDYVTVGGVPSICLPPVPVGEGEVDRGILCIHNKSAKNPRIYSWVVDAKTKLIVVVRFSLFQPIVSNRFHLFHSI